MKRIIIAIVLIFNVSIAKAGAIDQFLSDSWKSVSASENFHLLDNASADVFKSLKSKNYYAGSSTYLYKYWHLSADFVAIKSLQESSSINPGAGIRFHFGELLYTIPQVKNIADKIGKSARLIDNATIGISYTRNFSNGENVPMIYGGIVKKLGPQP